MEAQRTPSAIGARSAARAVAVGHTDGVIVTVDELFASRYVPLCRMAAAMVGDRDVAEQLVMDAFEEAVKRWASIEDPGAYVRRSVMNKANTLLRRRTVEWRANTLLFARAAPAALPTGDEWVARQPVLAAVLQLPLRQRAVVVLYYLEDLAVEDIATTLGCSAGAVKNRLSVARGNLRHLLGGQS